MTTTALLTAESSSGLSTEVGNPWANIGIFVVFVGITLWAVLRASKKTQDCHGLLCWRPVIYRNPKWYGNCR